MHDDKPPIILLHGALGSGAQLAPLAAKLSAHWQVQIFTFSGHGGIPPQNEFSIQSFAAELKEWIERNGLQEAPVFGFSMGGYIALYLEFIKPGTFSTICTLGTKLDWSPESAAKELSRLNPEKIEQKIPQFAELLAHRHRPLDWKEVIKDTSILMHKLGEKPLLQQKEYSQIKPLVTLLRGSEDTMVSAKECRQAAQALPQGQYVEIPGQAHPFEQFDMIELRKAMRMAFDFRDSY